MTNSEPPLYEGLPMATPPNPEVVEREKEKLSALENEGFLTRTLGYLKLIGPGYMQSALTLGGGTAAASLFAGAAFGYQLLWVAPVAMLLGVIMLSAIAHQTLSTGLRPFAAMRRYAGPFFAYGWAIGALLSSIIWHFAQYSLASAVLVDMGDAVSLSFPPWAMGMVVLAFSITVALMYGASPRWLKVFEISLKAMVWIIILCFGMVVVRTGVSDFGSLVSGFFSFKIPDSAQGVVGSTVVLSGLAAAVGVNMVFLYPYSLQARGWGKEHRSLAKYDLWVGMFIPYVLASSLMVIATANTLHGEFDGKTLSPVEAAQSLSLVVGPTFGRFIFNLGILAMALSSITLQMLCCGFACSEMFGFKVGGLRYRLALMLPAPGFLGAVFWGDIKIWLAVPTSILCGFLLPIAYLGFIKLQRSREYMGSEQPKGMRGAAWLFGMGAATLVLIVFLGWYAITKGPAYLKGIF